MPSGLAFEPALRHGCGGASGSVVALAGLCIIDVRELIAGPGFVPPPSGTYDAASSHSQDGDHDDSDGESTYEYGQMDIYFMGGVEGLIRCGRVSCGG